MPMTFTVELEDGRYALLLNGSPYMVQLNGGKRRVAFSSNTIAIATARLYQFLADSSLSDEKDKETS